MIKIPLAPFGGNLRVFTDVVRFLAYIERYSVERFNKEERDRVAHCTGLTFEGETKKGEGLFLMLLPEKQSLDTLVHEVSHLTDMLMIYHECPIDWGNTEQRAYTSEYFFREISKALKWRLV